MAPSYVTHKVPKMVLDRFESKLLHETSFTRWSRTYCYANWSEIALKWCLTGQSIRRLVSGWVVPEYHLKCRPVICSAIVHLITPINLKHLKKRKLIYSSLSTVAITVAVVLNKVVGSTTNRYLNNLYIKANVHISRKTIFFARQIERWCLVIMEDGSDLLSALVIADCSTLGP